LPPGSEAPPATPASAATGAVQLPLGLLRRLHGEGRLKADKLKVAQARLSDIVLGFKGEGGQLRLHPLQARLYQGSYSGNIGLDVRSAIPVLSLEEKLSGISIGPLLQDVMEEDLVSGTGNVQVTVTAQGVDPAVIKQTLNGSASLSLRDGAVQGVNLGQMIREAYAKVKGLPPPPATTNQTDFAELSASMTIRNGLVSNNDLLVKTPLLRIGGKGLVDLPEERIDYLVSAAIVGSAEGQGGKELAELKSLTIPVKITGSFDEPKFGLDLKQVMKGVATTSVKKKVEEQKKESAQKLEQKLKENLKKLF
jgi:AsmA protein